MEHALHFTKQIVLAFLSGLFVCSVALATTVDEDQNDTLTVHQHTIVPGDTLWDLSERYLGTPLNYVAIKKSNQIENEYLLQPGKNISFISARFFPGIVTAVTGQAHSVIDSQKTALTKGTVINEGSLIQTQAQSFIKLQFMNQAAIEISPDSTVLLHGPTYNSARNLAPKLELQQGGFAVEVPSIESDYNKLEVLTSHLTLGVRGTHFRVQHTADKTLSQVLAGKVALFKNQQQIAQVNAGDGAVFNAITQTVKKDRLASKPILARSFNDQKGLHLTVEPQANTAAYKIKVYRDSEYSVPVQEFINQQHNFLIPAEYSTQDAYYLVITTLALNGLESFPLVYKHTVDKVSVMALERSLEFTFPYCNTEWRVQLAESENFQILAIDQPVKNSCSLTIHNLPSVNWHWQAFEGDNDIATASGQVQVLERK